MSLHRASLFLVTGLLLATAACSGGAGAGGSAGNGGASGAGTGGAGNGGSGSGSGGSGAGGSGALGGPFRHGINFGYFNPNFTDVDSAWLSREAGADSARLALPEHHLVQWGYDIEVGDMKSYATLGMKNHVAFLNGPIAEHSTAPAGTPQWQLDYFIPKNLSEPVLAADGSINPNNYWAAYVYQTVSTYKDWVRIWEVWNEPDWVSDWQVTQTWDKDPPTKDQLVRFGGSIFDYVRMLRVTYEAARKADPTAKIALGGIGYPTFLSAVLRYTDNPDGGSKTADFPATGAAYFDVVSYHYYPLYTPGSSDPAAKGFIGLHDEMQKVLDAAGVQGKSWVVTETGAPHVAISNQPSGAEYARNYLVKAMVSAQAAGIGGVDWFVLSDAKDQGASDNAYDFMGLYLPIAQLAKKEDAQRTETGWAYRTLGQALGDAVHDAAGTAALSLPDTVGGAAFQLPDKRHAYVLWARTQGNAETASATYSLASAGPVVAHAWDSSKTGATEELSPAGGKIDLMLSGSPQIFVEK
jgi:hypothetical protein